jgi:hypothetical protein
LRIEREIVARPQGKPPARGSAGGALRTLLPNGAPTGSAGDPEASALDELIAAQ